MSATPRPSKPPKNPVTFALYQDQVDLLDAAVAEFSIRDREKALRALLDYASQLSPDARIDAFAKKRCLRCPPRE